MGRLIPTSERHLRAEYRNSSCNLGRQVYPRRHVIDALPQILGALRQPTIDVSFPLPFRLCTRWRACDAQPAFHAGLPLASRYIQRLELLARVS